MSRIMKLVVNFSSFAHSRTNMANNFDKSTHFRGNNQCFNIKRQIPFFSDSEHPRPQGSWIFLYKSEWRRKILTRKISLGTRVWFLVSMAALITARRGRRSRLEILSSTYHSFLTHLKFECLTDCNSVM